MRKKIAIAALVLLVTIGSRGAVATGTARDRRATVASSSAPVDRQAGQLSTNRHWAFQPPQRPSAPKVKNPRWVRNPIDAFVLARFEQEKVTPSPEADRATLIRRLSLDLLGLPPTPAEVEAFRNDKRPEAYERLVDALLTSPHFGERWGRHWLDMARYADSDGYEKDTIRPYAYLYRDWVIKAINRDLRFDQFTLEQLAGDLLPNAAPDQMVATGFHRQTLTNKEGGVDAEHDLAVLRLGTREELGRVRHGEGADQHQRTGPGRRALTPSPDAGSRRTPYRRAAALLRG